MGIAMNKSLVIYADSSYVTMPGHPRGAYLRGLDQRTRTGGRRDLYAGAAVRFAMTYTYDGKEYIMIAVSGATIRVIISPTPAERPVNLNPAGRICGCRPLALQKI